jgi:HEAT repeat protein
VYLIGKLNDKETLPLITNMTKDKNSQVRIAVAEALGTIGTESETSILVALYRDNDNFVRAAAIRSLGMIKDSMAVDVLIGATNDESAEVRSCAVDALGILRNSRAIPSLYAMLKDKNETVREKAKLAVKLHTEMPLLIDALDDESRTIRANVAYILWLLTGQDFGDNKKEWSTWAAAHAENNLIPEDSRKGKAR